MRETRLPIDAPGRLCMPVLVLALLQACAADDPERRTKEGAGIGAITGAVIGHQIDSDRGRVVGAAIGAIAGASVGRYQDEQQRALERALAREREARTLEIQRLQDDVLAVSLSSDASFEFDRADIRPALYPALDRLARTLSDFERTVLHVVGHTDSVGDEAYNRALSIRRARNVAQYLMLVGVAVERLSIDGRGESEPRVPNDSAANRQLNRRVEIYIKPVVEGEEERARIAPRRS